MFYDKSGQPCLFSCFNPLKSDFPVFTAVFIILILYLVVPEEGEVFPLDLKFIRCVVHRGFLQRSTKLYSILRSANKIMRHTAIMRHVFFSTKIGMLKK